MLFVKDSLPFMVVVAFLLLVTSWFIQGCVNIHTYSGETTKRADGAEGFVVVESDVHDVATTKRKSGNVTKGATQEHHHKGGTIDGIVHKAASVLLNAN